MNAVDVQLYEQRIRTGLVSFLLQINAADGNMPNLVFITLTTNILIKLDNNPMVWMIMVNGFIIDARRATYEIQEQAYNAGIMPYIPANKATA